MRFRTSMFLITMFVACCTIAAWSTPLTADTQSLSGRIATIGDGEFSVQVTKDQDVKTVQFLVDDKTKVEGKLAVGAQATVEYRSNADKNIAVHVIVTPASGISSY